MISGLIIIKFVFKMAAEAAALLDQLMGRTRNTVPGDEDSKERRWSDSEVRPSMLVKFKQRNG